MALKIYGIPRSRGIRNIWMAYELGIDFELVEVAPGAEGSRKPEFMAINPNGHVPFIDDDGLVLNESMAINLYLARKHGGPLAPKDAQEEGLAIMWALWAATECETHALNLQQHLAAFPPEKRRPEVAEASLAALKAPFAVLDKVLAEGKGHVMGGRFTVADINVAEVIRYAKPATQLFDANPNVKAWLDACQARPAFQAMWQARDAEAA